VLVIFAQILLRNRATNLNARTHDGTTPLILAARLAIEGMVEDLITADADINAADNSGKTALHWAAAVNNVDAVSILLAHGANRDAQDDKVSRVPLDNLYFLRPAAIFCLLCSTFRPQPLTYAYIVDSFDAI